MKAAGAAKPGVKETLTDWARTIFFALLIALGIRTILFEPFNIPSSSMVPTLLVGDFLFVSKWSYGYSRHSLPFSPPLGSGRLFGSLPERGDVVVFKTPQDNRTDFIKRVVGLPGDRIQVQAGRLYINGKVVERQPVGSYSYRTEYDRRIDNTAYSETFPEGSVHSIIEQSDTFGSDNTGVYTVPEGHLFMMGDNRDNSNDSRMDVGFVPLENLVGKAQFIFMSFDGSFFAFWEWPWSLRGSRFGTRIQ
jgi:signal peptidase I